MFIFSLIIFCANVPYCTIKSKILFLPLNIDKALEQHTCVTEILFSQQVPSLSISVSLHWPTVWLRDLFTATE